MGNEGAPIHESLSLENKVYLREMSRILGRQGYLLSLGGMSGDRTRLGRIQTISQATLRAIVADDEFLFARVEDETLESDEYFREKLDLVETGRLACSSETFTSQQKDLLTRLAVLYEYAHKIVTKEPEGAMKWIDGPIGFPIIIVKEMLGGFIDEREVERNWKTIEGDDEKLEKHYVRLRLDVHDLQYLVQIT